MLVSLITIVPVGLVLGLLTFGHYPGHEPPRPTPARVAPVALAAILIGPVAVSALGVFQWFLLLVILVGVLVMIAMLRTPPAVRH